MVFVLCSDRPSPSLTFNLRLGESKCVKKCGVNFHLDMLSIVFVPVVFMNAPQPSFNFHALEIKLFLNFYTFTL